MKYLTLLLTLLPFMLTAQQSAPESRTVAGLPPQLEEDVSAGNQEWIEGLKAGDADRIVASYSQDSIFCNAVGDCVRGPAAIAAQYQEVITKFGRATDAVVRSEGLQVDHDLAYEFGSAEAHFANGAVRKGRYSTVWKLQSNGHWKIFRNMSLSAPGA